MPTVRDVDGLQRLSLLLVIAGLTLMYASSAAFRPEEVSIAELDEGDIGSSVRVRGTVRDYGRSEDAVFFDIRGE
ncbi:MAG: hypothetical protein ABEJ72_01100, partial [Candidatus Aenigmatarchaeota archaeon]